MAMNQFLFPAPLSQLTPPLTPVSEGKSEGPDQSGKTFGAVIEALASDGEPATRPLRMAAPQDGARPGELPSSFGKDELPEQTARAQNRRTIAISLQTPSPDHEPRTCAAQGCNPETLPARRAPGAGLSISSPTPISAPAAELAQRFPSSDATRERPAATEPPAAFTPPPVWAQMTVAPEAAGPPYEAAAAAAPPLPDRTSFVFPGGHLRRRPLEREREQLSRPTHASRRPPQWPPCPHHQTAPLGFPSRRSRPSARRWPQTRISRGGKSPCRLPARRRSSPSQRQGRPRATPCRQHGRAKTSTRHRPKGRQTASSSRPGPPPALPGTWPPAPRQQRPLMCRQSSPRGAGKQPPPLRPQDRLPREKNRQEIRVTTARPERRRCCPPGPS